MLLHITHETIYRYSQPVEIQPHLLRFRPRNDGAQSTISFDLCTSPQPAGTTEQLDLEGNLVRFVWFEGAHTELSIKAATTVQTHRDNPFDFLKPHAGHTLPSCYRANERSSLANFLTREIVAPANDPVGQLAAMIAAKVAGDAVSFLTALNQEICERVELEHRDSGHPFLPHETLSLGAGACRDTAVLFIDACRSVGIAARFASGYHLNEDPDEANELHGWAEAYIPNAGWRGFDPSVGIVVADEHVTVAASSSPQDTAPVTGAYCGRAATSLDTRVAVQKRDAPTRRMLKPAIGRRGCEALT